LTKAKSQELPMSITYAGAVTKDPWYLATNLPTAQVTEACYRWRMRIKAGNRDDKTGVVLRKGGDDHQLTAPLHVHRLLLANLCLHWLAALTGLQAHHDLAAPQAVAPALETVAPDCHDLDLLDHRPALPPSVIPHRSPHLRLPHWMQRFAVRGYLSYVRLGMEILRDPCLTLLVRRMVRWLGLYFWTLRPFWLPATAATASKHWWPVPD
jgi:hypothetical protein